MRSFLMTFLLFFIVTSVCHASRSTNMSYGEAVKMAQFRVQKDNLYHATKNTNVEMEEAAAIIGVESSWVVNVKNKSGSGATGLFQYINGTWVREKSLFSNKTTINKNASRTDAKANITIGVLGLERNKQILSARTNRPISKIPLGDLYIAHLLGVDKAAKVINGNPNALLTKYVKITKGNERLYIKKNGHVKTVSEFRTSMNYKLESEKHLYQEELKDYQLTKLIDDINQRNYALNYQPKL